MSDPKITCRADTVYTPLANSREHSRVLLSKSAGLVSGKLLQ